MSTAWMAGGWLLAALTMAAAETPKAGGGKFTLSSPELAEGKTIGAAQVFNGFGCSGGNISPALSWSNPPAGTRSFALLVHDPDAPTGSGWWHWVVYNIPATTTSLAAGAGDPKKSLMPAGAIQELSKAPPKASASWRRRGLRQARLYSAIVPAPLCLTGNRNPL